MAYVLTLGSKILLNFFFSIHGRFPMHTRQIDREAPYTGLGHVMIPFSSLSVFRDPGHTCMHSACFQVNKDGDSNRGQHVHSSSAVWYSTDCLTAPQRLGLR